MRSKRLRSLALGGAITALAVWTGLTYWPPASSEAATDDETLLEDALEELPEDSGEETETAAVSPPADHWEELTAAAPRVWPPDPFFRSAPAQPAADPGAAPTTRPDAAAAAQPAPFALSAILGGEPPLALIDGRVVGVGDTLAEGVTIVAIDDLSVTIAEGARIYVLRLPG